MKSLQVLTPSKKCMFNCPFCISSSHEHNNDFLDNYQNNHQLWVRNYIEVLTTYLDLKYVVITGTNEPMQSPECVLEIVRLTKQYRSDIQVEIQTRDYRQHPIFDEIDVVAYSISSFSQLSRIKPKGRVSRYTIILTNSFEGKRLNDILGSIPPSVSQVTFKVLQDSSGYNQEMDLWIEQNSLSEIGKEILELEISKYQGDLSIRYDANCMDANNRYMIFRSDGYLYQDWETKEKVKK